MGLLKALKALAAAGLAVGCVWSATALSQEPVWKKLEQPKIIGPIQKTNPNFSKRFPLPMEPAPGAVQLSPQIDQSPLRAIPVTLTERPAAPSPGSYQQSCRAVAQTETARQGSPWRLITLTAECATARGAWVRTSLNDPDQCQGDIWNDNGVLGCTRPPGVFLTNAADATSPPAAGSRPPISGLRITPQGSYRQSCTDFYIKPGANELRAQCRQRNGQWRAASINIAWPACASFSNDDGWLSCDSAPLPRGPWRQLCSAPSGVSPDLGFTAICPRPEGGLQSTALGPCGLEVDNLSGFLTCGLVGDDLPTGQYRQSCVPTGWSAREPTLWMTCSRRSFVARDPPMVQGFVVNLSSCARPYELWFDEFGTLLCRTKT